MNVTRSTISVSPTTGKRVEGIPSPPGFSGHRDNRFIQGPYFVESHVVPQSQLYYPPPHLPTISTLTNQAFSNYIVAMYTQPPTGMHHKRSQRFRSPSRSPRHSNATLRPQSRENSAEWNHSQSSSSSPSCYRSTSPSSPASTASSSLYSKSLSVPDAVRMLLCATQDFTTSLHRWSIGEVTDNDISDAYVEVGTLFNNMVYAFSKYNIDLSHLHSIPMDLRYVLEEMLSEDASPEVLRAHMPGVRSVFLRLLKGLKECESLWKSKDSRQRR